MQLVISPQLLLNVVMDYLLFHMLLLDSVYYVQQEVNFNIVTQLCVAIHRLAHSWFLEITFEIHVCLCTLCVLILGYNYIHMIFTLSSQLLYLDV